jgi:hypothetical protein
MNFPRVALAAITSWALYLGVSYLVHGVLLAALYTQHLDVMRPADERASILPLGFGVALIGFFAFSYAYAKGYEGTNGVQEGLRFGVLVGILLCCFGAIWEYAVWPVPAPMLVAWLIDFIVEFALYGMVVGLVYKPSTHRRRAAVSL